MPLDTEILVLTNAFRAEHALPPLTRHEGLTKVAMRHAASVADGAAPFSHAGARERFQACGARCINVAENLARSDGFDHKEVPKAAMAGWTDSPGHRRNLLGPFDVCGVGWAASDNGTTFVTQLLVLLDERDKPSGYMLASKELSEGVLQLTLSTPAVCAALGAVAAGPLLGGVGGLLVGGALKCRHGVKAASLPRAACGRASRWLQPSKCARCGGAQNLLLGSEGSLLCESCHPVPGDNNLWKFVE
mmetsp:Transcript_32429/g.75350  ORF Transcript_32429/g.75350 Transcript_32429/m.75350 type:complete len:247 (-) Transcript_32429:136-876(-)